MKKVLKPRLLYLLIISLVLFLIPKLFWFNGLNYVGGDDTLLYYLFPKEMIKNYIFNIISGNGLSGLGTYAAQWYQFPFFALIYIVKSLTPFINTQHLFYGLTLSSGFIFFYIFLGLWFSHKSYDFYIRITGGLLYVFSIFAFYTLWSGLFVLYIIPILPLCLFLFIKSVLLKDIRYVVIIALILTLFSILILSVPWTALALLGVTPVILITLWKYKIRTIGYGLILFLMVFLFNFYWLFHFFYPVFNKNESAVSNLEAIVSSEDFKTSNENTIRSVVGANDFIYPLFNLYHKRIQEEYGWKNYTIFSGWHHHFIIPYMTITVLIILPIFWINKEKKKNISIYLAALTGWLITVYFFTVRYGYNLGIYLFLFLNKLIPGFGMFRNVYGKIAPALPFTYALIVCISLKLLFNQLRSSVLKKFILGFIILLTIFNAKPFIFNEYFSNPIWTTENTYTNITDFNQDFYDLMAYTANIPDHSNIMWVPMNIYGYVLIQDRYLPNHYYSGLSPVQFLTGKTDIAGTSLLPGSYSSIFLQQLLDGDFIELGKIINSLNINYIIVNKNISGEMRNSYLYGINKTGDLYDIQQDKEFRSVLLGSKLKSFGDRYEIYRVNDKLTSQKFFLASENTVNFKRIENYLYKITIPNLKNSDYLYMRDPFNPYWKLYQTSINNQNVIDSHIKAFGYANSWKLDTKLLKVNKLTDKKLNENGSNNIELLLYFQPQKYFNPGVFISGVSIILALLFLAFSFIKNRRKLSIIKKGL